ncbi:MAG TPA: TraR/DksA C4-type zinc finger protein [Verrucomicrobiae bacterium]|nr:TraR/DksA C4-type zinc finger protein [Verrucomicrobiae bacterium]
MATRRKVPGRKPKAATEQILTGGPQPAKIDPKWEKAFERLMQVRATFDKRRSDVTNDALSEQPTFSSHMADAGTDTYDRDLALGVLSSEQEAIYEVDEAIARIRDGTYGICELTGRPIEPARLEAIPWTRFCAEAEKQLEREGALKHTRLGRRETVGRESASRQSEEQG